ncbi:hypothetical protein BD769DRAFT_1536780 [Suillus cothurnatus]|nr:hypothetical protein BD769DRAFT_1536780 [Suillus cothurnatus]
MYICMTSPSNLSLAMIGILSCACFTAPSAPPQQILYSFAQSKSNPHPHSELLVDLQGYALSTPVASPLPLNCTPSSQHVLLGYSDIFCDGPLL